MARRPERPPADTSTDCLTAEQTAARLNLSVSLVYDLVKRGHLPAMRLGPKRALRIHREDVEAYIAEQRARAREQAAATRQRDDLYGRIRDFRSERSKNVGKATTR